jgi:hypothetical protein
LRVGEKGAGKGEERRHCSSDKIGEIRGLGGRSRRTQGRVGGRDAANGAGRKNGTGVLTGTLVKTVLLCYFTRFFQFDKFFLHIFSSFNKFLPTLGVATVTVGVATTKKTLKTTTKNSGCWKNLKVFDNGVGERR